MDTQGALETDARTGSPVGGKPRRSPGAPCPGGIPGNHGGACSPLRGCFSSVCRDSRQVFRRAGERGSDGFPAGPLGAAQ